MRYSFETMVVDQASKNVWERERETIQEKVDELKEQPQLDNRESVSYTHLMAWYSSSSTPAEKRQRKA